MFELGARGAGRFAMQSGYFGDAARTYSGQGAAFRQLGNVKVAVFTIVNSLGAVVNRDGTIARCAAPPCGTITNQKLPVWALQRLAVQVHTSMARAIQTFHTTRDGDVLFAATTGEVENDKLSVADLGVIASEVAWDAVLSSVPQLDPADARPVIKLDEAALERHLGRYEFAPGVIATVTREGAQLQIEVSSASPSMKTA